MLYQTVRKNFQKMFPSLVGFGWEKVWHGDMVVYAMQTRPQNSLEKTLKAQEYLSVYKNISSGKLKAWSLLSKQMMEVIGYER